MKEKLCKKLLPLFFATAVLFAAFALAGCGGEKNNNSGKSGDVVLNVESVVFTVKSDIIPLTDTTSLKDYLDALKENGELEFEGSNGNYGYFIESVFGKKAQGNNFWAVYTDLVTIEGDSAVYSNTEYTFTHGDKTLNSANYGVSNLPCVSGYTYALVYSAY